MKTIKLAALLMQATVLFGQYQYYLSDTFGSVDSQKWWPVGNPVTSGQGLSADGAAILVSQIPVADYTSNYEVKTTIKFGDHSQDDMFVTAYLRVLGATPYVLDPSHGADLGTASYYSVETYVTRSTGMCTFTLNRH